MNELDILAKDFMKDPRQLVTKQLLDAIAYLWRDEQRFAHIELWFRPSSAVTDDDKDPGFAWFSYLRDGIHALTEFQYRSAREVFNERFTADERAAIARSRVETARWELAKAEERLRAAQVDADHEVVGPSRA